jgi:hypothetical protein
MRSLMNEEKALSNRNKLFEPTQYNINTQNLLNKM